ncbi:MAG TPA: ATP-binding cassette domain-containing protein [Chitinophagales bacterium]|nr:ATP-binding cassette domain-containing protein [Chitinophagales bacterium]
MIELQNIRKVFNPGTANQMEALKGVNLNITAGEFVVIVGANGSGKTTLLNIISGSEICTSGKVLIDGNDVTGLPDYRRSRWIARVFQNPLTGTAPDLSILDNFRLAAIRTQSKGLRIGVNGNFRKIVKEKIAMLGMGLEDKVDREIGALSGGQRQALTLLMSVMDETKILLLDEPTAALDPRSAATVMNTAQKLIKDYGFTSILITHNLKDAHQYGNRLIQMNEGEVIKNLDAATKAKTELTELFTWFA